LNDDGPIALIETAYAALEAEPAAWLEELRAAAQRCLPRAAWVTVSEVDVRPGSFRTIAIAAGEHERALHESWHAAADPALIEAIYLRHPVSRLAPIIEGTQWVSAIEAAGVRDVVGAIGIDPSGRGTVVSYGTRERSVSRGTRVLFGRLAAHLASASRLRASRTHDEEAICDASGRVLDATGEAAEKDARTALRDAARRIDAARTRNKRADAEERLALWNALVDGKWSLLERFDTDGRRLFVARRNEPAARRDLSLSDEERKVVALAAIGRPQKVIAYELGLTDSMVSTALRRAMAKLGVSSRSALIELHGSIVAGEEKNP
jgi:DNA-binding CsgD family transcriptional regulator